MAETPSDKNEPPFIISLREYGEAVVPYPSSETSTHAMDNTAARVRRLLGEFGLETIGGRDVISGGRYTNEHGYHYYVRVWDPDGN
jgi:hypothetical protein